MTRYIVQSYNEDTTITVKGFTDYQSACEYMDGKKAEMLYWLDIKSVRMIDTEQSTDGIPCMLHYCNWQRTTEY